MATRNRQRNMDPTLKKWIEMMARRGHSPAEIHREIEASDEFVHLEKLPVLRTVERVVEDAWIRDKTGPWSITDCQPEDSRIILDVLADVIFGLGAKRVFTKAEAAWILRIRKLAPDLSSVAVLDLALSYISAEGRGESTEMHDWYLAFKPWRNMNRLHNFDYAVERGWIEADIGTWFYPDPSTGSENFKDPRAWSLDDDHSMVRLWKDAVEREEPLGPREKRKRLRILEENPALGEDIKRAWEAVNQRQVQLSAKRLKRDITREDIAGLRALWKEYRRLLDSFKEEGK